jgi:amino acid transporter
MGTDLEAIVNSPIDQPVATILFNSLGQKGTLAIWSFIVVVQFALGTNLVTACSRQVFAFSRDGGLPLSRVLYYISPRTHSPVTSVWFVVICAILLGLLSFAGPTAISAVFSIVVAGQYVAYSVPIAARYLGGKNIRPGPFSLGFMSLPVAVVAVTFMIFIVIVFTFPNSPHPAPQDMNYTVVVLGGTLTLAAAYYYFPKYGGVYWFEGPIRNIPTVPDSDDGVISVVHEKGSSEDKK